METLFENTNIIVRKNSSDEIFITNKRKEKTKEDYIQAEIRVSVFGKDSLHLTANNCNFCPTSFNGLGGFTIRC